MSDDEKNASAAWQDVANALAEWINKQPPAFGPDGDPTIAPVYTAWTLLTHLILARAADAQQIAALQAEKNALDVSCAALQDANDALSAQLTALQAEQAQWQQAEKRTMWRCDVCGDLFESESDVHRHISREKKATRYICIAAVTAQPDGSLPTRQPKP